MEERELRSKLFRETASRKKEFDEHLACVWAMSEEDRSRLLKSIPAVIQSKTRWESAKALQQAVSELEAPNEEALKAVSVLQAFASFYDPFFDNPEGVMEDVVALRLLPEKVEEAESAKTFLRGFLAFVAKDSYRVMRRNYSSAHLPNLKGLSTLVDYRAVVETVFDWQTGDPEVYAPVCKGVVPVILVRFTLDESGKSTTFQCDVDDLDMIIRKLRATKKELEASSGTIRDLGDNP